MTDYKKIVPKRRIVEGIVATIGALIAGCVVYVMLFKYRPDKNALGALGSVCMDVTSMLVLIMLLINLTFEKSKKSIATKLFLALMFETLIALFLDFLVWAFDGSLAYGDITYVFIVTSLCSGPIIAGIFVLYLSSYFYDMYGLKSVVINAKICFICNLVAFFITITLAATGNAFAIVDGHYEIGSLYDFVTIIPVFTVLYMMGYAISQVRVIGVHDLVAVAGYILIMIGGAMIEAVYDVGTTYVSITIADIFIFAMLQNKLIERVNKQKQDLLEKNTSQYKILSSMAGIYSYINYVDIEGKKVNRFDGKDKLSEHIEVLTDNHTELNKILIDGVVDDQREKFWEYTDLTTLSERMKKEKLISNEFLFKEDGWVRAQYIRIGDQVNEPIKKVIYVIRNIDEEKKNIEKWIERSNTDNLTGFYNRYAYEEESKNFKNGRFPENGVYVSMDVNGLKVVNDMLGHAAGDELIVGACECIKQCFGPYGKLFRVGGDEFVAVIYADETQLEKIKKDVKNVTESWKGKLNPGLTLSCGYVIGKEAQDMTLHQVEVLADKRMYEDKTNYYQKKGIDRRGRRDAHVALCASYTKIFKINITNDTYQIVNIKSAEKTEEQGYSEKLSEWMSGFGTSGQVHPDDLEEYLAHTSLDYMRSYFRRNNTSLKVFYKRKYPEGFKPVMLEIIPANDYTDDDQNLFLYVKSL